MKEVLMDSPGFRKILELTGYSSLLIDFVEKALPDSRLLPRLPGIEDVRSRARERGQGRPVSPRLLQLLTRHSEAFQCGARARENIRRLENPKTAAIVVPLQPVLFGGPLSTLLKCLTAVKLASALDSADAAVVPVCWIGGPGAGDPTGLLSVNLLDSESILCRLLLERRPVANEPIEDLLPDQVETLVARIEGLGQGMQVDEILGVLRQTYPAGISFATATGRYLTRLFENWGLVAIDASSKDFQALADETSGILGASPDEAEAAMLAQHSLLRRLGYVAFEPSGNLGQHARASFLSEYLLPVAAHILDFADLPLFSMVFPLFQGHGMKEPVIWPHAGATVLDTRSRKIMDKYAFDFEDLLAGGKADSIARSYSDIIVRGTGTFDEMMSCLDTRIVQAGSRITSEQALRATLEGTREKIGYQIEKLREKFIAGTRMRAETAARQIERVRSCLLPAGRLQQYELGGLHFILRYSAAILEIIRSRMDILNFRHQLISVE